VGEARIWRPLYLLCHVEVHLLLGLPKHATGDGRQIRCVNIAHWKKCARLAGRGKLRRMAEVRSSIRKHIERLIRIIYGVCTSIGMRTRRFRDDGHMGKAKAGRPDVLGRPLWFQDRLKTQRPVAGTGPTVVMELFLRKTHVIAGDHI